MAKIILCAMEEEANNIKCPDAMIIVTGIGASNVIKAIAQADIKPTDNVINVGYAGSSCFNVGEVLSVGMVQLINDNYDNKTYYLNNLTPAVANCYTANTFIENGNYQLVDMELFYLMCFGFQDLKSLKIVSDNLNYNEFKRGKFERSWNKVNKILEDL